MNKGMYRGKPMNPAMEHVNDLLYPLRKQMPREFKESKGHRLSFVVAVVSIAAVLVFMGLSVVRLYHTYGEPSSAQSTVETSQVVATPAQVANVTNHAG